MGGSSHASYALSALPPSTLRSKGLQAFAVPRAGGMPPETLATPPCKGEGAVRCRLKDLCPSRLFAFALCLVAHAATISAVALYSGAPSGAVVARPESSGMLTVYLKKTETSSSSNSHSGQAVAGDIKPVFRSVAAAPSEPPVVPLPVQADPHYFRVAELSERPRVLQDIRADLGLGFADVPEQAIVLRLFINEEGGIDLVAVEESNLPPAHEKTLTGAFANVKFRPGMRDNIPVKSQLKIEVKLDRLISPQ